MEEYVCELCDVSSETNVCEMCGSPILIVPKKGNQESEMMNKLRQPLCLFQITQEGRVHCNTEIIERIRERFDPSKKLVVLVAAGLVGTGKSTWMNAILYKFCGQQNNYSTFKVGYTAETETEGLWVFPHPLTLNELPDVQFMIMDMEGMNGIKACPNKEQVEISLRKIFMVGMIVGSVFTLHTHDRVDSSSVDLLQNTFKILDEHRKQLGVEFPRIMLLVKDSTEVKVKSPTGDFRSLLRSYGQFDKTLDEVLEVYPKPEAPLKWRSADQDTERFTALENSEYQQFNYTFIKHISEFGKRKPALTTLINIEEFCQLLQGLSGSINDTHFADYFKGSIGHTISSIIQPLLDRHIENFEQQSMELVSTLPLDTSLEKFKDEIKALTKEVHQSFFSAVRDKLNVGEESEHLKYAKAQLVIRTKSYMQENMFIMRQNNSSQIEVMRQNNSSEIEKIKLDNEALQAKADTAYKNLDEKMRFALLEQEEQVKKSQELFIQMKRENEEALLQVKLEFTQKLEAIEHFYKNERAALDKKYDDEKKMLIEKKEIEVQKGDIEVASQVESQLALLKKEIDKDRAELNEEMVNAQASVSELNFNNGLGHYQKDNYVLAKQHFESAASLDCGQAYYYLGVMHLNGEGVKKDMVEAGKLFLKAIEHSKDPNDACQQYQLLVEQGIASPITMPDSFSHFENDVEEILPDDEGTEEPDRRKRESEKKKIDIVENYIPIEPEKPKPSTIPPKPARLPLNKRKPWKVFNVISTAFKNFWTEVIPLTPAQSVPTVAKEVKSLSCKSIVLSLENFGLQRARQIVTDCEAHLQLFLEKKLPNPHNLTADEIFAVICYTYDVGKNEGKADDNIYFQLNNNLREVQNTTLSEAWNNFLYFFQAALAKIPSETTVVFRGIGASSVSTGLKNYRMHRRVQWSAFTSASRHISYAKNFAKKGGVVLRLSVSTGKSISAYSYIAAEDEIILSPNMTFLVVKDLYRNANFRYIDFVQEEPNNTFVF